MWIPNQQLKLKMRVKKEKTFRIKTNNQELLIRKQNESDATSWWIEFQKTSLQWKAYRIQDWFLDLLDDFTNILNLTSLYSITIISSSFDITFLFFLLLSYYFMIISSYYSSVLSFQKHFIFKENNFVKNRISN